MPTFARLGLVSTLLLGLVLVGAQPVYAHSGDTVNASFSSRFIQGLEVLTANRVSFWNDMATPMEFPSADGDGTTYIYITYLDKFGQVDVNQIVDVTLLLTIG